MSGDVTSAKGPHQSTLVIPNTTDVPLSTIRTDERQDAPPPAADGIEAGEPFNPEEFPQLSNIRSVLLVGVMSSAGFLTVRLLGLQSP